MCASVFEFLNLILQLKRIVWKLIIIALNQSLRIKNKKEESLEDLAHVLDMVGRGLESFDHTSKYSVQKKEHFLIFVYPSWPEVEELTCG